MELTTATTFLSNSNSNTNPSLFSSSSPTTQFSLSSSSSSSCPNPVRFLQLTKRQRRPRTTPTFLFTVRSSSSSSPAPALDWSDWQRLSHSIRVGSQRFWLKCADSLKKDTGLDIHELQGANVKARELCGRAIERVKKKLDQADLTRFRTAFLKWNRWERWKEDLKDRDPKRIGAVVLYILVAVISCHRIYAAAVRAPILDRQRKELAEAYMEALVPQPSPTNIRKFKMRVWRKTTPKGLKMKKFIEGADGTLIHDQTFVGEDAWEDDEKPLKENVRRIIDNDRRLKGEEKNNLKEELGFLVEEQSNWRQRLNTWKKILRNEKLNEQLDSFKAKYVVEFDMKEVEKSLRKDAISKETNAHGMRAEWIAKRWWRYRHKLPYTYFLQKLDSSEIAAELVGQVAAVVFTEDLKRIFVTMKEGFPLEYIVDIPLDPYLFETISSSGVEFDLLQKRQFHYFMKVLIALVPGLLILWLIRESVMLLHVTSKRFLYKKYNQLFDMAYTENFILPLGYVGETKSMYREVVLGGHVWDLLDELMIYMGNPMQYYDRGVKFVRGVLLSGPPGTGKTLFARTLAKESGLPFVFASGAEFTDSEKSGAARINEMFSIARRNGIAILPSPPFQFAKVKSPLQLSCAYRARTYLVMRLLVQSVSLYQRIKVMAPAFVFVDEVDAIAGKHARKDPRRRATFEALIAQLDGEKEKTGVDRFSLRQAVIFICATNRPDELDLEFVRPGRIDRCLYIGLPDAQQRGQIFNVHSAGKQLAEDVEFRKLVFCTVGFSGADIRNLVNESAIMSVRKGHSKICQQDIGDVLDKQLLEGMGVLFTEEEQQKCKESVSFEKKKLLAVHEAGHVVLAHLFLRYDWHAFSQLLPGGKETAISVFYPREDIVDQGYTTFGYMKMQMVITHGGRCAERVVFGDDITDGGKDDLEKITKARIAREMVISPQNARLGLACLTKRIGLFDLPDSPDGELIKYRWDDPHVVPANMSLELSELFTRELTRYIEETEELAVKGLCENRHILDAIADKLLEDSRITGLEVEEIKKQMQATMFEDFVKPFQINLEEDGQLPHNDKLRYKPLDIYSAPLHKC